MYNEADCVVYICGISEYNLNLYEDNKTNRLTESLNMFDEVMNSKEIKEKRLFLILNKVDLFKKKLEKYKFSDFFSDYKGIFIFMKQGMIFYKKLKEKNEYESVLKYIEHQFKEINKYDKDRLKIFHMNLIDHEQCILLFENIFKIISE
jgi:GTPase involved in cell partitioning and DNA repair